MKNIVFFLLLVFIVCCGKETIMPCQADGFGVFKIHNGFHLPLEVFIALDTPGDIDSTQYARKTLNPGEDWQRQMPVGKYYTVATGEEPGPFAHDKYKFEKNVVLDDCEATEIEY